MPSISRIGEPHLKHERVRCNRSFAGVVFWLTLNSSGFLEFAGRNPDRDGILLLRSQCWTNRSGFVSEPRRNENTWPLLYCGGRLESSVYRQDCGAVS